MLFPPTFLPLWLGMALGMACTAGCGLLMENEAEQRRKWLLKQAANVEAAHSTCLHNY